MFVVVNAVCRIVLMGRFAAALCDLSPSLQTCMCPVDDLTPATTPSSARFHILVSLCLL